MIKRAVLFLVCALIFQNLSAQTSNSQNSTIAGSSDPILLIAPFDKDTIDELNPIFNWSTSSVTSVQVGDAAPSQISYKFLLVKINSGQTKESAIQENQPIFYLFPAQGNMLQYPISATELQRGNRYAWKIEKYLNGALLNQSEVWEFFIKEKEIHHVKQLAILSKENNNRIYFTADTLGLYYKEDYSGSTLLLEVSDQKGKIILSGLTQKCITGDNIFYYSLSELNIFGKGIFNLKLENNKNEIYFLKVQSF